MAKKLKSFHVQARMIIVAGITIEAENFEEAVAESKTLDVLDFVKIKDELSQCSIVISSISKPRYWDTDQD